MALTHEVNGKCPLVQRLDPGFLDSSIYSKFFLELMSRLPRNTGRYS
jgi:hypothetical protein